MDKNCRVEFLMSQIPMTKKNLISLNKTVEALFREATFKLNRDFQFSMNLWFYEDEFGWTNYTGKMTEGSNNYIQVRIVDLE